ncbi:hypothetical protein WMY93_024835 [Mugilogobius chulae]|uniref:Peptidase M28 domain-containing protein n=1 Tax=Mugilogobius chulae TaxID=88201 RepID=A0AAW0N5J5_9GOBI
MCLLICKCRLGVRGETNPLEYICPGEVVDVNYGSVEDLRKVKQKMNVTNQIAVMKLGRAPLLYKDLLLSSLLTASTPPSCFNVIGQSKQWFELQPNPLLSLLSRLGFGGALLYVDPCDAPQGQNMWNQAFSVTLNPGGDPAQVGVSKEETGSLSSLLVQPISPSLAQTLLSAPITERAEACTPLATPPNTEPRSITLTVGNQWAYRKIYNVIGFLKGKKNPDRYVLVGSHHDAQRGGGASAIQTELVAAFSDQTKKGWVPDRTTVFCSWGDQPSVTSAPTSGESALCKHSSSSRLTVISSVEQLFRWSVSESSKVKWSFEGLGEAADASRSGVMCSLAPYMSFFHSISRTENRVVLQSSAVAYVSLDCPVRGTETLRASASPSLLQLTSDIQREYLI